MLAKQKEYVKKKYATDEEFRRKNNERSRKYAQNNIEKVREMKRSWANKHYKELREKGLLPPSKKETIEHLQQRVEQLEKENEQLQYLVDESHIMKAFIVEHNKCEQLENIIKEVKEMFNADEHFEDGCYCYEIEQYLDNLNILNKGSENNG